MVASWIRRIAPPGLRNQTASPNLSDGPLLTNDVLESLQRLAIASQRIQTTGFAGEHRSKLRGVSPEFADFKSYTPGDDFRRVDWNLYARLDELFLRLSEVTTDLTVHFLIDASASMDWASQESLPTKFRFARQIAGAIGYIALWRFDRVLVAPFNDVVQPGFGPGHGRSEVGPLIRFLTNCRAGGGTNLSDVVARYLHQHPRPGLMIILSDLLSSETIELNVSLRAIRRRGWEVTVIQLVDDGELEPARLFDSADGSDPVTIVDSESNGTLMITPNRATLDRYEETVTSWLAEVEATCTDQGARYLRLATSEPIGAVVMRQLHRRGLLS